MPPLAAAGPTVSHDPQPGVRWSRPSSGAGRVKPGWARSWYLPKNDRASR